MQCMPMGERRNLVMQRYLVGGSLLELPQKKHSLDVGWDFFAPEDIVIPSYGRITVDTGIA